MINRLRIFIPIIVFLICGATVWGQENIPQGELQDAYQSFDATIGLQNTEIFTGVEYIEKHRMINDRNKFFGTNEFVPTTVVYERQPYFNIPVKYNVFDDVLLVKLPSQRGETDFKLLPNRLEGFMLNSIRFINVWEEGSGFNGIYQLLYEGPQIQALKKHRLSQEKISRRELVHYEFKPQSPEYYFKFRNDYYELSRRNLLEVFPDHKSEVREQYKRYRKQKREQRDNAIVAMFQRLSELSNDNAQ